MSGPRGTLVIDVERCKGCELCIAACPPDVLVMSTAVNTTGYRYPLLEPGCTGCTACQLVCPDQVFEVYRFPRDQAHPGAGQADDPGAGRADDPGVGRADDPGTRAPRSD